MILISPQKDSRNSFSGYRIEFVLQWKEPGANDLINIYLFRNMFLSYTRSNFKLVTTYEIGSKNTFNNPDECPTITTKSIATIYGRRFLYKF